MNKQEIDVKQKIIISAKKLFSEQGYEGTSVRKICDEAGVSLPLVSYHFGGKENVFLAILEPLEKLPFSAETGDPKQDLQKYLEVMIAFYQQDREISLIVRQELAMNSTRADKIITFIQNSTNKLKSILENGRDQGVFQFESISNALRFILGCMSMISVSNTGMLEVILGEKELGDYPIEKEVIEFIYKGIRS
ncbi:TetR/AcrR family transcriptional regulator [Paenibacillus sp. CGMCC 1.16610]|uniref:TetR family transcriptional regulator n=1 Tax=Paenibacillus anseongense TaxID=2682845 RepID=A0ABW9U3K6_9BACL|nr:MULTISPECIES: TetR family transcriptional regulator [Paenibacillus]MBA2938711.1 TetR/AcrR family transcriptional regulator [Paenibacillus sp. CGMCC 1.16610]MVQ34674.1 TetR family transcriptional regulator [Paenibacillus anseongense]